MSFTMTEHFCENVYRLKPSSIYLFIYLSISNSFIVGKFRQLIANTSQPQKNHKNGNVCKHKHKC